MLDAFRSSILLQLESSNFWEFWVRRNNRIQSPRIQNPVCFRCFNIVQTSQSRGQHLCSKFAKIPHLGCARTFKVPTSPLGPPFDITLIAALQLGVTCVGFNCFRSSIVTFLAFKVTYRIAFLFKL